MNTFYNEFDTTRRDPVPPGKEAADYRGPFQTDRDRIIYTSAFRRLQAKTQVFLSGEYDFYRTRLTHSIEVAQIGRSICDLLRKRSGLLGPDFFIDPDLVEGVCLAHDLGHPPFGHAGERTLQRLMTPDSGGFEGNAQSLRIVTRLIYSSGHRKRGMNPTRAFVDGILKYKTLLREQPGAGNHFLYDDQKEWLDFVQGGLPCPSDTPRDALRSIECQIMDWADDTAYSLNDVVDSVRAGFLRVEKIEAWAAGGALDPESAGWVEELLRSVRARNTQAVFGRKVGEFIGGCRLEECGGFLAALSNRHRFMMVPDPASMRQAGLFKRMAFALVFRSSQVQQLEYKGDHLLARIFSALETHYAGESPGTISLLPEDTERRVRAAETGAEKRRLLCDYLAGMTDGFAVRTYERLFDPRYGSIADLA